VIDYWGMAKTEKPAPEVLHELTFGALISQACESYKTLEQFIVGTLRLEPGDPVKTALSTVQRGLARDFLFSANRIYRLCTYHRDSLQHLISFADIDKFVAAAAGVKGVRDINEHGIEPDARPESRPTLKMQEAKVPGVIEMTFYTDERWLVVRDWVPFMGEINLRDLYSAVDELRKVAGYHEVLLRRGKEPKQ
jgi:hypothetical protein